jgi:predicted outer membrane repeat protein
MPIYNPPTPQQIGAVPTSRLVNAGLNMTGGGSLANDITLNSSGGGGGGAIYATRLNLLNQLDFTATGTHVVNWENALFDDLELWNIATPSRINIIAGISRVIIGSVITLSGGAATNAAARIKKNGTTLVALDSCSTGYTTANFSTSTGPLEVAENDYFEFEIEYASGANRSMPATRNAFYCIVLG